MFVLRFNVGEKPIEVRVENFTLWREDAGFNSERLMDVDLQEVRLGPFVVQADEEGITSIVEVTQPSLEQTDPLEG